MIQFMESVFGQYHPVTSEVMTSDGAITVVATGMAGVDWVYVGSVFLFGLFLFCLMRIVGSLFSRS